ncbi:hypothetical protein [Shewanella baltica]|uniref:hypothetical protein n=1 Tax=Shewanella baltica TaxID=62322 RepID=UPI00217F13F9|nr:hypothetical protein [Shewanella baltica]MCS6257451.1 hypothetical protein [Shewanella baltica]MCS6272607.1 hypothetical protein [Shewanella baltica]
MDVQTMQALVGLLTLLVTVFGGLLMLLWAQLSSQSKALGAHEVNVAKHYVTKDEHDRRITQEINGLKELLQRVEKTVNSLLELNQSKGRGAA